MKNSCNSLEIPWLCCRLPLDGLSSCDILLYSMRHAPIGEQVRAWRGVRGLSQRALAEKAGVVPVLVARLELGQTDPRLSTLTKLAEALKLTVGELVDSPTKRARGKR